jgi:ABC-type uncharacterized transport system substrate-binding protein
VVDNARNEVRNEEGCGAINPCRSVIVTAAISSGRAAKKATTTIPIVFASVADAVEVRVHQKA